MKQTSSTSTLTKMRTLRLILCISILFPAIQSEENCPKEDERVKRQVNSLPLVFPYGGTYKLLIGYVVPVENKDHINFVFSANFQYQYLQIQNITQLSQYYFIKEVSREERDADIEARREERLTFYRSIAGMLDHEGMNGMECVLRAICEAAQYPVEDQGLVGEIIHILLTRPDYGKSPFDPKDEDWETSMSLYIDAATAGRQMFSCPAIYADCPEGKGVMELISILTDN